MSFCGNALSRAGITADKCGFNGQTDGWAVVRSVRFCPLCSLAARGIQSGAEDILYHSQFIWVEGTSGHDWSLDSAKAPRNGGRIESIFPLRAVPPLSWRVCLAQCTASSVFKTHLSYGIDPRSTKGTSLYRNLNPVLVAGTEK